MRWWDILVPIGIVVVGLAALENPLGHAGYAAAGVLLCAAAAYAALLLGRRSGVVEFFDRFRNGI
jgi:hypothetical protein